MKPGTFPSQDLSRRGSPEESVVEFFFASPSSTTDMMECSTLCLLRRDIVRCFWPVRHAKMREDTICESDYEKMPSLFPGLMLICAGIDLLAKFFAGSDEHGDVGRRFRAFVREFGVAGSGDPSYVWELRNALMHSFGLRDLRTGKQFGVASKGVDEPFVQGRGNRMLVQVPALHRNFLRAVKSYHERLTGMGSEADELGRKFCLMFEHYGRLLVTRNSAEELLGLFDTGDPGVIDLWDDWVP